jgi:DNA-binding NarL/FixJ family response regulator
MQSATKPQTNQTKSKILLVDDHAILTAGLAELINQQKDLMVCGTAVDQNKALSQLERMTPDLVLVDISLKGSNGIELLKNLKARYPKLPVLILSMHEEEVYAMRAVRAGASGFIMKQEATDKVLEAIRKVLGGEVFLSERMERRVMQQFVGRNPKTGSPIDDLSDRELEVFNLLGQGRGTRQIAEQLHLSIKTIESHRTHIKEKLNLKDANELIQHAIQWRDK